MANIIDSATNFLEKVRSEDYVKIKFKKADGSTRLMKCTLNFDKIPKKDKPKNVNLPNILNMINKNGLIRVYDLEKKGWRSVKFQTVEWVEDRENIKWRIKRK